MLSLIFKKLKITSREKKPAEKILMAINQLDFDWVEGIFFEELEDKERFIVLNPTNNIPFEKDPFLLAVSKGCVAIVALFIPYIKNINRINHDIGTSLHAACQRESLDLVKLLLANEKINPNQKNSWLQETPLHLFIRNLAVRGATSHSIAIAKLLINHPRTDLTIVDQTGLTAPALFERFVRSGRLMPAEIGNELKQRYMEQTTSVNPEPSSGKSELRV